MSRREQARWRRERLLDAALDVFVANGIDRATMKDIAEAAGATPGLLYHYFEGKDALLATLLRERSLLPTLRRQLAAATGRPATAVLPELVRNYRQVLAENRGLVSLFFSASSTNRHARAAMSEFVAEGQRLLTDYLDARVAAGELRLHDTRLLAQTLLASVAASQHMGSDTDPDQLVDLLINGTAANAIHRPATEYQALTPMRTQQTTCCVVGGGPAGMMLGMLLARQGLGVVVLEKHEDFLRDFRGDTIHPSTLELVAELGWLEEFLRLPHTTMSRVTVDMKGGPVTIADFRRLPARCRHIVFMPQWTSWISLRTRQPSTPVSGWCVAPRSPT